MNIWGDDGEDPQYIINLLDPDTEHNCYFLVGDPTYGVVERIGVVSAMLMAHSLVLRRVLNAQDTELVERWDIPVTDVTPKDFKNMLKYAYGFNNIKSHSISDTIALLKLADKLVMQPMMAETSKHIIDKLTPSNVCVALQDPVCLQVKKLKNEIAKLVRISTQVVLSSEHLHLVAPACMRFIVLLESLQATRVDLWQAVIKWARCKVLKEHPPVNCSQLESNVKPLLIVPQQCYIRDCTLKIIQLVEDLSYKGSFTNEKLACLSGYHFVPTKPPRHVLVCTEATHVKTDIHITHKEFQVKVVHNCSAWIDAVYRTNSELIINTGNSAVDVYSIVCTANRKTTGENVDVVMLEETLTGNDNLYQCYFTVKVNHLKERNEEVLMRETYFEEHLTFGAEFQIVLKYEPLRFEPNSRYKIEMCFTHPHPLWYTNDIDYISPNQSNELDIGCGLVDKSHLWYGSHIRYVIYNFANPAEEEEEDCVHTQE